MANSNKINSNVPESRRPVNNLQETPEVEASEPQHFVVVLAYTSTDGQIEESFGSFIEDVKALHTFKQNVRVYALVEEAAASVLALVEKPVEES